MRFCLCLLIASCSFTFPAFAQKVKTAVGTYEYHAPKNITMEEAERIALERAKLQAIADEFGTIVSQSNFTAINNTNGASEVDFFSLGGSEVKGEWIETLGEPDIVRSFDEGGAFIVRVTVKGRIREITNARVDFQAKVLCNGTELKFERNDFRSGDDLYLYFKSPADGYINVYLLDEVSQTVYCLLPYRNSRQGAVKVHHDVPYIFFSKDKAEGDASSVDEYVMTCSRSLERNVLYVMFSTNEFAKAGLKRNNGEQPSQISWHSFQEWISKNRRRNKNLSISNIEITIKK